MAETIADGGLLGHEYDNYLDIDFDDAAGIVLPSGDVSAAVAQDDAARADEFDIQINEYEVIEEADNHTDNGEVPSGAISQTELAVPQSKRAESEIGYEDEEPLGSEGAGHEAVEEAGEERADNENDGSADNIDEINYEDGDLEDDHLDGLENATQSETVPPVLEEAATEVFVHQVLDDTRPQVEASAEDYEGADDRSTHKPLEAEQEEADHDDDVPQIEDMATDPATERRGSEGSDVTVVYNGAKYELCASVHNDDPETYFFAGVSDNLDVALWDFFSRLREVIKDEAEPSDELVIKIPQLKLEIGENTSYDFLDQHTFGEILSLYRRFKYNDGLEDSDIPQLIVHLEVKPDCKERLAMLTEAADSGRGWSEFFDNSDVSELSGSHHSQSGEGVDDDDEVEVEFTFEEEHLEGEGDDDMQHKGVDIVEEAYLDDTDDLDAGLNDQGAENASGHTDDTEEHDAGYDLAGELTENGEFDQEPDYFDEHMGGDDNDDAAADSQAYDANSDDDNAPASHGNTTDKDVSDTTGPALEDAGGPVGDAELGSFSEEAGTALEAAGALTSGNDPFSFRAPSGSISPAQQKWLDDFVERDSKQTTPEMWNMFDALPNRPMSAAGTEAVDEDFIDYSEDEDSFEQPAPQPKRRFSPPLHFPRRGGKSILDVPTLSDLKARSEDDTDDEDEEMDDDYIDYEEESLCDPSAEAEDSILPSIEKDDEDAAAGQAAMWVAPQTSFSSIPHRSTHSGSASASSSRLSQRNMANLSDLQGEQEPVLQSNTGADLVSDAAAHDVDEQGDDNFAANDDSLDMEGFTAFDDMANIEPPAADTHGQVTDGQDTSATSATSTLNGDEITYEDEIAAHVDPANTGHEAEDDAVENGDGDEIDWETGQADAVAVAEDPTNQSSPSSLSVKRSRDDDDLIGLDDESDAKRRKI